MALLIPMPRRASRKELTDALSSHYGSPGRLASYRRQFDKTERKPGEDPANFGITLETLAVKAFGDIGQTSRLRLIRDRFIAGHESCELRRHLDCFPPDTPLRDIVDRCGYGKVTPTFGGGVQVDRSRRIRLMWSRHRKKNLTQYGR